MSARSGDLDPCLAPYLARTEQITTKQFYKMVNHESGLLGISGDQFRHARLARAGSR